MTKIKEASDHVDMTGREPGETAGVGGVGREQGRQSKGARGGCCRGMLKRGAEGDAEAGVQGVDAGGAKRGY